VREAGECVEEKIATAFVSAKEAIEDREKQLLSELEGKQSLREAYVFFFIINSSICLLIDFFLFLYIQFLLFKYTA
jgi:hypothetical protein